MKSAQVREEIAPVLGIPRVPEEFVRRSVHQRPEVFLAHLRWGRVATRSLEVIGPDDRVFDDFFFPPPAEDKYPARSLIVPKLPRLERKEGTYATFANYRSLENYYHWMINCLTRLWILDEAGIEDYRLLAPRRLQSFQKESLDLLGFSEDRLAPFGNEHWEVESLLVPSYPMMPGHVSAGACQWLRQRLISAVEKSPTALPRRIYISRASASKRRLLNEEKIITLLSSHGFTSVKCEAMTLEKQVNFFRNVEVVVAPHGAGLTNVLFMNSDSLVIELVPYQRSKPLFCNLASAMGVRYCCVTNAPEDRKDEVAEGRYPDVDFEVPANRVAGALDILGI
ncbi:DUF563 domain-containing protein [candidate division KSB3 bacterium]|nr:DUF563 domain-containing protein [candidate division KSB3 bacterium]